MNVAQNLGSDPAWLYYGKVMHARMSPKSHRFNYKVFSLLIDINRLQETADLSPIFSIDRFNLLSFHQQDHLSRTKDEGLKSQIDKHLKSENIDWKPAKILLACYPRVLGKVFNPLSVFYIYKNEHELGAIIYQVCNTFGELHLYTFPINDENFKDGLIRQQADKEFYVSPFMEMNMRYFFTFSEPKERMSWKILEKQDGKPILSATYFGQHKPLSSANLFKFFLQIPFLTWKILIGIHFEALKLWLKGIKYVPRKGYEKKTSL